MNSHRHTRLIAIFLLAVTILCCFQPVMADTPASPELTVTPTANVTAEPTETATAEPTATLTTEPTATHTVNNTAEPTATATPTATITVEPTATPTVNSTAEPTATPTTTLTQITLASQSAQEISGVVPFRVNIAGGSFGYNADLWEWRLNGTVLGTEINFSHTFTNPGEYIVGLNATNISNSVLYSTYFTITAEQNTTETTIDNQSTCNTTEQSWSDTGSLSYMGKTFNVSTSAGTFSELAFDGENVTLLITDLEAGACANVTVDLPFEMPEGLYIYYWKEIPGSHIIPVTYGVSDDSRHLTFHLQDGVVDEDGLTNGEIYDPLSLAPPRFIATSTVSGGEGTLSVTEIATGDQYDIGLEISDGIFTSLYLVDAENLPGAGNFVFPYQLVKFTIEDITPGGSADVTITYPDVSSLKDDFSLSYHKFNPNTLAWQNFPALVSGNTVTLSLTDGGAGDDDAVVNGIIADDGGLNLDDPITHPALWNVSYIDENYRNISEFISRVGDGDTIRIWGAEGHTYEGGVTISAPNVTIKRWEGSPARPLITNTSQKASAISVTADNVTLQGLNISGNTLATNGAGVRVQGTDDDNHLQGFTITDCIFTGNTVTAVEILDFGHGSALYTKSVDDVRITDTTFESNNAANNGGGAYFYYSDNAILTNTTFENNTAGKRAGGAYFWKSDNATLTGMTFESNTATRGVDNYGGGACFWYSDNANIDSTTFENNTAKNDGGGACFWESDNVNLTGMTFENNTAKKDGGGVYFIGSGNATLTGMTFENNTAGEYGGGAYFLGSYFASLTDTTFENNTARKNHGGGASFWWSGNAILKDTTFESNTAGQYGGGAFFKNSDGVNLTGTTFENNTAGEGGGAYFKNSDGVILTGTTIENNTAGWNGGGAFFYYSDGVNLTGTTFENNTAGRHGGGAFFADSDGVILTGTTFESNTAVGWAGCGGGAYFRNSDGVNLTGTTFENNTAGGGSSRGGGAYFSSSDGVNLTGTTFESNTAKYGGGISDFNITLTIKNTAITNNTALQGGGVDTGESLLTITNTTISNNIATTQGDGMFVNESTLTLVNNIFSNDENIYADTTTPGYTWDTILNQTLLLRENIAGGPYFAGNVWKNPAGTGFSQTQSDSDFDGICDDTYLIHDSNGHVFGTDYLPLYYNNSRGTVLVSSTPQGADVLLDSVSYNHTTPFGYYLPPGSYSVVLTLPGYFNSPAITTAITAGCEGQINYSFSDTPTFRHTNTGPSPLTFVANATKTATDVSAWTWYITQPDGHVTELSGRNISTVLRATGAYTLTLNATWADKTTSSKTVTIAVLNPPPAPKAAEETSAAINGTKTELTAEGTQTIIINETAAGNVTTTGTDIVVRKTDGTTVQITTNGTTLSGGNVSGTVRSVTVTPPVLNATISDTVGNASVGLSMTMDTYDEDATITTEIAAGCADDARNAFTLACPNLNQVAYTVYFTKSGFDNESAISGAVLNFSVNTSWVTSMGGPGRITIIRWKDDGNSTQITPTYLGISGGESLFQVTTDGFSVYGVASVSGSSTTGTGGGGGSSASVAAASDLKTSVPVTLSFDNQLFRAITLLPAENISDVLVTVESKSGPEKGMRTPENATVTGYILTSLYHTEPSAFSSVGYKARISMKWLTEEELIPVVWYYNTTDSAWHQLEKTNGTVGTEYIQLSVPAEMPGFGWFAIGGVPGHIAYEESYLVYGPEESSPGSSNGQESPVATATATAPAPTATKKATPVPGIVIAGGIGLAAALVLSRRKE